MIKGKTNFKLNILMPTLNELLDNLLLTLAYL